MLIDDWRSAIARLGEVEARMVAILDGLGLTTLVTSVPGVSAVGAAVILAETGDLSRFATARSVVKHAGLNPAENTSANFRGQTRVSHRGRPALRAAAWRAAWGALPHNPVLGARFTHPHPGRSAQQLTDQQKLINPGNPPNQRGRPLIDTGATAPDRSTARPRSPAIPSPPDLRIHCGNGKWHPADLHVRARRKVVSAGHERVAGRCCRPRMVSSRSGSLRIFRMVAAMRV